MTNRLEPEILAERQRIASGIPSKLGNLTPVLPGIQPATPALSLYMVVFAALVDSMNPCGLSVLVFLLISMAAAGDRKRILLVGGVYIAAMFLFHLFVGIGLFSAFALSGLSKPFSIIGGIIALVLGIVTLADVLRNRETYLLSIPESGKGLLGTYIRKATMPAAFILGILAGILGFSCTGGIYISILGLMGRDMTVMTGLPWLVLYNIVFVLPLVLVTLFAAYGISPERAERWRTENKRMVRVVIGIILVALGLLILSGMDGIKKSFLRKIPFTRASPLPVFAHGNEDLKDLLDGYGVDAALDCLIEDRFQHFFCPVLIVDGYPFRNLDPGDLSASFCRSAMSRIILVSTFEISARTVSRDISCTFPRILINIPICPDTKTDNREPPYLVRYIVCSNGSHDAKKRIFLLPGWRYRYPLQSSFSGVSAGQIFLLPCSFLGSPSLPWVSVSSSTRWPTSMYAIHYGFWAEFRKDPIMLLVAVAMACAGRRCLCRTGSNDDLRYQRTGDQPGAERLDLRIRPDRQPPALHPVCRAAHLPAGLGIALRQHHHHHRHGRSPGERDDRRFQHAAGQRP